jgi:hypothetical protein
MLYKAVYIFLLCRLQISQLEELHHLSLVLGLSATVNPALLASSFVWHIQLFFPYISLFKIINRKYLIQSKCEFIKLLFVLLEKIQILPLYTVYLPLQLLHMLFFTPFRNF